MLDKSHGSGTRRFHIVRRALKEAALSTAEFAEELRKRADADEHVARAYERLAEV
jgi:hypothetical protein